MTAPTKSFEKRLMQFISEESAGGVVMLCAAAFALIMANTFLSDWYFTFIKTDFGLTFGDFNVSNPIKTWVKDVLMVFFFLLIGMELKRESIEGFLSDKKQILLPLCAAIGGMAFPAIVFLLVNHNNDNVWHGWAIPSATDIAFALCILMLASKHLPPALKIFLLAIAIFDDLGAILIIAFFYSGDIGLMALLCAGALTALLFIMNKLNIMLIYAYIGIGILLCIALHHAGIHTTIGGVIVGMTIPLRNPSKPSHSPLNKLMHSLHPWVSFLILPIFAFTASGISFRELGLEHLLAPVTMGVALGLFIGKQIGIFGVTWLMVKSGLVNLPEKTNWGQIYGVSLLAGIGFTMSLFIGALAFDSPLLQEEAKLGVIIGSVLSAITGWVIIRRNTAKILS